MDLVVGEIMGNSILYFTLFSKIMIKFNEFVVMISYRSRQELERNLPFLFQIELLYVKLFLALS